MTNYHLKPPDMDTSLPSFTWQENKAQRKQLLETVRRRRAERYRQFMQKNRRLQVSGDVL